MHAGKLQHCLSLLRPDAVLCDPLNAALVARVAASTAPGCVLVEDLGAPGAAGSLAHGDRSLARVIESGGEADVSSYRPADVGDRREHVAFVYFTSGTTGLFKAAMLTNHGFLMSSLVLR